MKTFMGTDSQMKSKATRLKMVLLYLNTTGDTQCENRHGDALANEVEATPYLQMNRESIRTKKHNMKNRQKEAAANGVGVTPYLQMNRESIRTKKHHMKIDRGKQPQMKSGPLRLRVEVLHLNATGDTQCESHDGDALANEAKVTSLEGGIAPPQQQHNGQLKDTKKNGELHLQ